MVMKEHRLPSGMLVAGATVVIAAATAYWVLMPMHEEAPAPPTSPTSAPHLSGAMSASPFGRGEPMAQMAQAAAPAAQEHAVAEPDAGTGVFRMDGKGGLLLDDATRIRLDILLSNLPKNATQHELRTVEAEAVAGLPVTVVPKALHILHAYLAYSAAEAALTASDAGGTNATDGTATTPAQMLDRLGALRRQHLGSEIAAALFGAQEMQERYGLQLAALDADTALTAQQKLARIDAMQQALPEGAAELHANLDASRAALALEQQVAALRSQGASEAQVQQLREQHLGPEGASSIGEMETHKADWERRQQAFVQQLSQIAQMNLSAQQKQDRVEALLRTLYSEEELPAARAYHQRQAGP